MRNKYVLDSNVALKWVLVEPDSSSANLLRHDFRNQFIDLIVPDVFAVEVAHALTRSERRGFIKTGQAIILLTNVISTPMPAFPYMPLLARAVEISSAMRCGVYDCLYVALAEQESCELVSADERMIEALQPTFPFIISLASLP